MARRPTRRQNPVRQPAKPDSIFDHFARHRPEMMPAEPNPVAAARPQTRDYDRDIAELRRQNEELQRQLNTPAIPRAPAAERRIVEPKDVRFSLEGMPDPITEPEKYAAEMQTRINATFEARQAAHNQSLEAANSQQAQSNALWSQFSEMYPDWAEDQEKVRFAAEAVINAAKAKGLDTEAYITTFSAQFCKDVAGKLEQTFGPLDVEGDEEDAGDDDFGDGFEENGYEDEIPRSRKAKQDSQEDEDGRTAGIFGGMESGGAPARGKQEKKSDMITDLIEVQRRSGFF